jgi:hypothetical protein
VEGISQPLIISKKNEKNPISPLHLKWTWVHRPFHDFRPVPLATRPWWAQISNHWRPFLLYKHHKTDMKRITYMDACFYAVKYHKTDMKQIIHNCHSREIPPFFT